MTPAARLQATLDLMQQIDTVARPADAIASAYFRTRRYIGSKDRAAVSAAFYTILRHTARLNWWLVRQGRDVSARHRLLAWLAVGEGQSPAQVDALFTGTKFAPEELTENERGLLLKLQSCKPTTQAMPPEIAGECPDWALAGLIQRFGDAFAPEMAALLDQAPLDLRVNSLKADRDDMLAALQAQGLAAAACPLAPLGIRVADRPSLADVPQVKSGELEVQDEGSQLVALLLDAQPGERVVDFCAGAGGKTLAIAAQMRNKGRITACDVLAGRLKRSLERFRRAGVHNIETQPLAAANDPWVKRHKGGFDRVLVDAPCSGTGTWRRNPDARWRVLGPELNALLPLQASILASAARLVKPGGRLVYATCSLLPAENEEQITAFLATHADYRLLPLAQAAPALAAACRGDYLALTPLQHNTDGFFAAVLLRDASPLPA